MMKYAFSQRRMCSGCYEYMSSIAGKPRTLSVLSIMNPSSESQEY